MSLTGLPASSSAEKMSVRSPALCSRAVRLVFASHGTATSASRANEANAEDGEEPFGQDGRQRSCQKPPRFVSHSILAVRPRNETPHEDREAAKIAEAPRFDNRVASPENAPVWAPGSDLPRPSRSPRSPP